MHNFLSRPYKEMASFLNSHTQLELIYRAGWFQSQYFFDLKEKENGTRKLLLSNLIIIEMPICFDSRI